MKSIETKYRAPVIAITGERILEREEIKPPTIWEEFGGDFVEAAGIHGGMIEPILGDLKLKYSIEKIKI